jgi:DNA polymerase III subunit delta'
MKNFDAKFKWPHVGNEHIIDFLSRSIINREVASSYIFSGPDNLGKTRIAKYFAKSLLCDNLDSEKGKLPCEDCPSCSQFILDRKNGSGTTETAIVHSDFFFINRQKDKKNISIDDIRNLIRSLGLSPFFNSYKVGVIKHAESLSLEAANALLKTMEEPKEKVVIILISTDLEALPLTIRSRCQALNFHLVKPDIIYDYLLKDLGATRSQAKDLSKLSLGRPALAAKWLENKESLDAYIERADTFLNFFREDINERIESYEKLIPSDTKGPAASKLTERIIDVWTALLRDELLIENGHHDLVHYHFGEKSLADIKKSLNVSKIIQINKTLSEARQFLKNNVSPKLALEYVAINI